MKIFLHGEDNIGWSIDEDRKYLSQFLEDIGHKITDNWLTADVIHSVWWNQLIQFLSWKYILFRFKKNIITTATNMIDPSNSDFINISKFVKLWIAPSLKQYNILKSEGFNVAYQPFYVDEKIFYKKNKSKEEIANLLGIEYGFLRNKIILGSFQRDTLGSDLKSPKWQKGPELLLEILLSLPDKNKWLILLAGPRRHFVISECEKRGIPFYYYGTKPIKGKDDINVNIITKEKMSLLYNLTDCYLVTSKSEGGPKAILEAAFCNTLIFSTDVGLATDILDIDCIYEDKGEVCSKISELISNKQTAYFNGLIKQNLINATKICSYDSTKRRWREIYDSL